MIAAPRIQHSLTDQQTKQYQELGYVHLRHVFDAENVEKWNDECDRLLCDREIIHEENWRINFRKYDQGIWQVNKFDPVVDISPIFKSLSEDERLLSALRGCFDDEPVLFKDKVILKLPGSTGFEAHQDWTWWQPFPNDMLSAMVAIDGADRSNGALEVYPGRHDRFLLEPGTKRNLKPEELEAEGFVESKWQLIETTPGDVILFHGLTPHRSGTNTAKKSRRQAYLSYNAAHHGNLYQAHYDHYLGYLKERMSDFEKKRVYFK